jgi:hypothetical protein
VALDEMPSPPLDPSSPTALITAMRLMLEGEIAILHHDNAAALRKLSEASSVATTLNDGAEFPALYYYSPHMALANLATSVGQTGIARAALQAELVASPRSPKAQQALEALGGSR